MSVQNNLSNIGSGSYISIPTSISETKTKTEKSEKSDQSRIKNLSFDPKSILKVAPSILTNIVSIGTTIASIMNDPQPQPQTPATFRLAESGVMSKLAGYRI